MTCITDVVKQRSSPRYTKGYKESFIFLFIKLLDFLKTFKLSKTFRLSQKNK